MHPIYRAVLSLDLVINGRLNVVAEASYVKATALLELLHIVKLVRWEKLG